MSWGIGNPKKRKDILDLMDIGVQKITADPDYLNKVPKSPNGCWMEQVYGIQRCDICDLASDCPVKKEEEWQEWLQKNNIEIEKKQGS